MTQLGVGREQGLMQIAALERKARRLDAEAAFFPPQHGLRTREG